MISFYLLFILVSLIEDSLKLATFYFRLDMGPVGIILAKISLELVYSRILGETHRKVLCFAMKQLYLGSMAGHKIIVV